MMNPKYPVYVISKGRWESRLTVKALIQRNIPYLLVIEPQEYDQYVSVVDKDNLLALPFSNLGQGSIPARNWVWEDSIQRGYERHWILDDNIRVFYRLHNNIKYHTDSGVTFRAIEDFVDRYKNVALSGMQYQFFTPRKKVRPPFVMNTRIYSCILIKNDIPYRWRGRYNEDTDLSLRALKDGWCTVLFNAFLIDKIATTLMKGGNTDELYQGNGRLRMAQSLQMQHPDVVQIAWRYGRPQHLVDYKTFKQNKLVRKSDVIIPDEPNEYGMTLQYRGASASTFSPTDKSEGGAAPTSRLQLQPQDS